MGRSIRWRLQVWYALVLVAVIGGFAVLLYVRLRTARFQEIDAALEADAQYLDVILRRFPLIEFAPKGDEKGDWPEEKWPAFEPKGREKKGKFGPKLPPDRDQLRAELVLPLRLGPGADDPARAGYFGIWRGDGTPIKLQGLPGDVLPPRAEGWELSLQPRVYGRAGRREVVFGGPMKSQILVGRPIERDLADLRALAGLLAGLGAVVLVVGLVGGWIISARIFRPLAAISATAATISATNLGERIDTAAVERELQELAGVLNDTFARLQAAFERQVQFTADASHELRTPLAIVRSHAELALSRPRSAEEYRAALETCVRAAGRMAALVDGLLTLARADAGKLEPPAEIVELDRVIEDSLTLVRPLAQARGVMLAAELERASLRGDAHRLGQVVTNLVSNAIQYNRTGGNVTIRLVVEGEKVVLSVADTGVGIPLEDQPHVFERFYRVDKARSRASGGHGLGLAICKSIVEAHGGTLSFSSAPDAGSIFVARFPRAGPDPGYSATPTRGVSEGVPDPR